MTVADTTARQSGDRAPGLCAAFEKMDGEFADSVIRNATKFWQRCKQPTKNEFEGLVRGSGRNVPGFQLNVPGRQLPSPDDPRLWRIVGERAHASDRDAGIVLKVWMESKPELCRAVVARLEEMGTPAESPDFEENRFRDVWKGDAWMRARDELVERLGGRSASEVALMICCVSGRLPELPLDAEREPETAPRGIDFSATLARMRGLEVGDSEWDGVLRVIAQAKDFIAQAEEIVGERVAEAALKMTETLAEAIDSIRCKYADELEYLEIDLRLWSADGIVSTDRIEEAPGLLDKLGEQLSYYREVFPRAAFRSVEIERAKERREHEEDILATARLWRDLSEDVEAALEEPQPAPAPDERPAPDVGDAEPAEAELELERKDAEIRELRRKLKDSQRRFDDLVRKNRMQTARNNRRLLSGRPSLYIGAVNRLPAQEPIFSTVKGVVDYAEERLRDRVAFALNSHSEVERSPFANVDEVWNALLWLSEVYYGAKSGIRRVEDLDASIRKTISGWTYAAGQHDTTVGRHPVAYTAVYGGIEYELRPHLGKGASSNPRHTIRIGFAWADELAKVIVGYIGPHQPTRRS